MIIKGGRILIDGALEYRDIAVEAGKIVGIGQFIGEGIDVHGAWIIPGAVDVHCHLREPGYTDKGTVATETASAAKGGVTTVFAMPNVKPVPDCIKNLAVAADVIRRNAVVRVRPYGSITVGQSGKALSDMESLAPYVVGFSDDGKDVGDMFLLGEALQRADRLKRLVASHTEAKGVSFEKAEEVSVKRESELALLLHSRLHFCHLSTKESFLCVKKAVEQGADISCEVTPHHLFLSNDGSLDTNRKMNPPLRSEEDRQAAEDALLSGVCNIVATDHAPHSKENKELPYEDAPNGIIGLETLLPTLYTYLVRSGKASYADLIKWTSENPSRRFGIPYSTISVGSVADITALDIDTERIYEEKEIVSMGKNSPFIGKKLYGFPCLTMVSGKVVFYKENN